MQRIAQCGLDLFGLVGGWLDHFLALRDGLKPGAAIKLGFKLLPSNWVLAEPSLTEPLNWVLLEPSYDPGFSNSLAIRAISLKLVP
jgi:hypothetical protein